MKRIKKNSTIIFSSWLCLVLTSLTSCTLKIKGYEIVSLSEKSWRTPCIYNDHNTRPSHWAVSLKRNGLPNLYKVSGILYRGAQPNKEGIKALHELGIKTIINFRNSSKDLQLIKNYPFKFKYFWLPMKAAQPDRQILKKFLDIVSNPENQPVFVHCLHGADRTGLAVALYRIKIEAWNPEDAINEMIMGCYHFHEPYASIFPSFIREF